MASASVAGHHQTGAPLLHQFDIAADIGGQTGRPVAMASRMVLEMPSPSEGSAKAMQSAHDLGYVLALTGQPGEVATPAASENGQRLLAQRPFTHQHQPQPLAQRWLRCCRASTKARARQRLILDGLHAACTCPPAKSRLRRRGSLESDSGPGWMKALSSPRRCRSESRASAAMPHDGSDSGRSPATARCNVSRTAL
jgi:hypothetical protein